MSTANLSSALFKDGMMPLFATAREIHEHVPYGDQQDNQTKDETVLQKQQRADQRPYPGKLVKAPQNSFQAEMADKPGWNGGLTELIKEHGYDWNKPVRIDTPTTKTSPVLMDGHHRVAVMLRDRPDEFIPLTNAPSRRNSPAGLSQ